MAHTWSLKYIRFVGYFLTKIMKSIYRSVQVDNSIILKPNSFYYPTTGDLSPTSVINNLAEECPVLYMLTHRSYADFLIFAYVCFYFNLPLPSIAAGIDFLSLNQVASLLRACGAFFIRRSFKNSNDLLYWHTFRAYVQTQLKGGERPLEFFVEGTRSRSGKFLYPKIGLLSIAMELYFTSQIPDLIIVPVSLSYDRTLEEELYAKELLPPKFHPSSGTKPKETTKHLFRGAQSILAQDYGSVYIRFGEPLSVKEICDNLNIRRQYSLEPRENTLNSPEHLDFVNQTAIKVIEEQKSLLVISPFTLFSLYVLSKTYLDSVLDENESRIFQLAETLSDLHSLSLLIDQNCLSHVVNKRSFEDEFIESLKIHNKLVTYNSEKSLDVMIGNPLVVCQMRHYSNQALQLMIEVALCCYTASYNEYCILQDLLSREFIFTQIGNHQSYENYVHCKNLLNEVTIDLLAIQVCYFVDCYEKIIDFLKTYSSPFLSVRELIKAIHNNTDVQLDVIQNAMQLFCDKGIVSRTENVVNLNNLLSYNEQIKTLYGKCSNFCSTRPEYILKPKLEKSKKQQTEGAKSGTKEKATKMGAFLDKPKLDKQTSMGTGNGLRYGVSSMQGWRLEMEDAHCAVVGLPHGLEQWSFFAVFDGHAGPRVSAHCAEHLLDCIVQAEHFRENSLAENGAINDIDVETVKKGIRDGFLKLDEKMKKLPEVESGEDKSGSTAVCALISPNYFFFANCGDSRAVLSRGGKAFFSTLDHKPINPTEKERIQRAGGSVMIQRVNGSLAVSRALGDYEYKQVEGKGPCEQLVSPEPEITVRKRDLETDEFLVLACDGIWDVMSNEDVCDYVRYQLTLQSDLEAICSSIIDTCLHKGSKDNMSVVLVVFEGAPKVSDEAQKKDNELNALLEKKVEGRHSLALLVLYLTLCAPDFMHEELVAKNDELSVSGIMQTLSYEDIEDLPPGGGLEGKRSVIEAAFFRLKPSKQNQWDGIE
ncbi:protein phosphatase 1A-like isoform X1 [Dinothrombium tinctorium]|uniref:Protein phosphatase 1A-like isoform X1 n=1 Tax=Dinothrombium tinctorium TaxID=1965070 RepID=A0A443R434_9ACAR|nr:protein phosphatase 1A-like isoform X1 [Dinothrombium tinctorium]